jgi:hypothetical protein
MSPATIYALGDAHVVEILPEGEISATGDGTGVDVSGHEGVGLFILNMKNTAGGTPTLAVKLQHSDDDGDADPYTDVTAGAFTALAAAAYPPNVLKLNLSDCKRWVRPKRTLTGDTAPKYFGSVTLVAFKKYNT